MFRQIIVGLDGSVKARKAAHVAFDLARLYDGTVTLVHVLHPEAADFTSESDIDYEAEINRDTYAEVEEAGQKIIDDGLKIADDVGCKKVETQMPYGDAATEILAHADQIEADLIVTGRRGLSSVSGLVLGSTTQRINHLAKCACLSIP
ncbi:universal stress protein [Sulfitobacter sp. JB4-11]|uniref:universal stress protein n=1 Tax=Sulfitobacter rhodophyticola TaxID=3238304 RepID=UPI0035199FCA